MAVKVFRHYSGNLHYTHQELRHYAPGDGALDFVWTIPVYPYPASGRRVMRRDVTRFLKTKDGKRLAAEGWKVFKINGLWRLVHPCVRTGENALRIGRQHYTYEINPKMPREGNQVWDCDLTVWCKSYNKTLRQFYGEKFEVKNLSTRAQIRFFLTHEQELTQKGHKTTAVSC